MIKPPALRIGDTVGVVAPASNIHPDMLSAGCLELESLGFQVRFRDDITAVDRYFAGTSHRRENELRTMLLDESIRGIFCARGGYGSGQLLELIDPGELASHPKIFCGSSDLTMMLSGFQRAGLVAFHGPMVATAMRQGSAGYDRELLLRLLVQGEAVRFSTDGCEVLREGQSEGRLTGGCLSLVVSTLGTPWEIDTTDTILVLEDNNCRPFQVDRMLTHMKQAGKLTRVRGFVFGEMLGCEQHPEQGYTIQEVIDRVLDDLAVPILFGFPTGHASGPDAVVPFGVQARLSLGTEAEFQLLEPAVTLD